MDHPKWSQSEKRLARSVFDRAVELELEELMADVKRRAAEIRTPEQMWSLGTWIEQAERKFSTKYDFRYSQLLQVFGCLLSEGRIAEQQLDGLAEEKLQRIRLIASLGGITRA